MKNPVNLINLQSQVGECYTYFKDNQKDSNFDVLEEKMKKLKQVMIRLTVTNLVNVIDRVVEDGRKNRNGENKQFNVSSIQITDNNKINLICHEVIGFDNIDKKFILESSLSYLEFTSVIRIY